MLDLCKVLQVWFTIKSVYTVIIFLHDWKKERKKKTTPTFRVVGPGPRCDNANQEIRNSRYHHRGRYPRCSGAVDDAFGFIIDTSNLLVSCVSAFSNLWFCGWEIRAKGVRVKEWSLFHSSHMECCFTFTWRWNWIFGEPSKQGRIHGIRCYETPFSAVKEKALRTYGPTDRRTDRRTDGQTLL